MLTSLSPSPAPEAWCRCRPRARLWCGAWCAGAGTQPGSCFGLNNVNMQCNCPPDRDVFLAVSAKPPAVGSNGTWTHRSPIFSGAEPERRQWLPGQPSEPPAGIRAHSIPVADGQLVQLADRSVQHDDRHAADVPASWGRMPIACGHMGGPAQCPAGSAPLDR
jgi:hypothetical protein